MEKSDIRETRIKKEKELLEKNSNLNFKVEFCETSDSLEITTEVHSFIVNFFIDIPEKYPFEPPKVTLNQNQNLTTLTDFEKNEDILEQVLGES